MNVEEKLQKAQGLKEEGNLLFKSGEYKKACKTYFKVFLYTRGLPGSKRGLDGIATLAASKGQEQITEEEEKIATELECITYTNITTCQLKLQQPTKALEYAQKAIEANPNYWKAYLRLAETHIMLGNYDKANEVLDTAGTKITSSDRDHMNTIQSIRRQITLARRVEDNRQRQQIGGFLMKK